MFMVGKFYGKKSYSINMLEKSLHDHSQDIKVIIFWLLLKLFFLSKTTNFVWMRWDVHKNILKSCTCFTNDKPYESYFVSISKPSRRIFFFSVLIDFIVSKSCFITQLIFQLCLKVAFLFHCNHLIVYFSVALNRETRRTHEKKIYL